MVASKEVAMVSEVSMEHVMEVSRSSMVDGQKLIRPCTAKRCCFSRAVAKSLKLTCS